jgi:hypothetical protein
MSGSSENLCRKASRRPDLKYPSRASRHAPGRLIRLAGLILVAQLFPASGPACVFTLQDGNSEAIISAETSQGMNQWLVDGQNQLAAQWFWFRVGSCGPETPLNGLPLISATQSDPATLETLYANRKLSIRITYSLSGGASGSGSSVIQEQITIMNRSSNPLSLHFFQYTDMDLAGTAAGDTVQLDRNLQGQFSEVLQSEGDARFAETIFTAGANHAEAGYCSSILNRLNDRRATRLSDKAGPIQGDATWALQWDPTIAGRSTFSISLEKSVRVVPEPAATALVPLGWIVLRVLRRSAGRRP